MRDECDRLHVKYREANYLAYCFAKRSIDFFTSYVWDEPTFFMERFLKVLCVCDQ